MARTDDVAAAVLVRTGSITTKKLQKLVYYSQAWHLAFHGRPLFDDEIQAWVQGPVVRSLYEQHRTRYEVASWPAGNPEGLDADERRTIDWVIGKYGHFSAEALSNMTHAEVPWRVGRGMAKPNERVSDPIPQDIMKSFYARQRATPDVAVSVAVASAAMEGVLLDDDWQETLREVVDGTRSAEDVISEEIRRAKAT